MTQNRTVIPLLLTLCLGGCAAPEPEPSALTAHTTEAPNPIQLSLVTRAHTVPFASSSSAPDATEVAKLNDFLARSDAAPGKQILIERAIGPLDDKRTSRLLAAFARQGLKPTVNWASDVPPNEMRVVIENYVATAPNCPNWSKAPGNDFANTMHSDFGCSTASNLAAMVADPRDLEAGRTMGPASGDQALSAIHQYRTGKPASSSSEGAGPSAEQTFTVAPAAAPSQ